MDSSFYTYFQILLRFELSRRKEVVFVVLLYFMKLEVCFCLQIGTTNNYSIVYNYLQLM